MNKDGKICLVDSLQHVLLVVCQHFLGQISHSFTNIFPGFNIKLI